MIHFSPAEYRCAIAGIVCFLAFIWALMAEARERKIENDSSELLEELERLKEDHISGAWSEETIN